MGRTHSFIVMRILELLFNGSETGIHSNEFKTFTVCYNQVDALRYRGIEKSMPIYLNLKEDASTYVIYQ